MIAYFSTKEGSSYDPIIFRISPGSELENMPSRGSRSATLYGGTSIDWRGSIDADRVLTVVSPISESDAARLKQATDYGDMFRLSFAEGCAEGVVETWSIEDSFLTMRFLPKYIYEPTDQEIYTVEYFTDPISKDATGACYSYESATYFNYSYTPASPNHFKIGYRSDEGGNYISAAYFLAVGIPGNPILSAVLQFYSNDSDEITAKIQAVKQADTTFPTDVSTFLSLPLTDAYVEWSETDPWTGDTESPDFTDVVNEVVALPGFTDTSPLMIVVTGTMPAGTPDYNYRDPRIEWPITLSINGG